MFKSIQNKKQNLMIAIKKLKITRIKNITIINLHISLNIV